MVDRSVIVASLERVAERHEDPTNLVYARLFAMHPDLKCLFDLDTDGGVRGSMLQTCIECILGVAEDASTQRMVVSISRFQHAEYGVPNGRFDAMFVAVRDTFRDILRSDWTEAMEANWAALLDKLATITYPPSP